MKLKFRVAGNDEFLRGSGYRTQMENNDGSRVKGWTIYVCDTELPWAIHWPYWGRFFSDDDIEIIVS